MGVNNYQPHLLILSEDDAYKDMANGFFTHFAIISSGVHIAKPAGGKAKLLDFFLQTHVTAVRKYQQRHVLLLLDLDGDLGCRPNIVKQIPTDIHERVFFLCSLNEAENIKKDLGSGKFEAIGEKLAEVCYTDAYAHAQPGNPWLCPQLEHNRDEVERLARAVRPFLFNVV